MRKIAVPLTIAICALLSCRSTPSLRELVESIPAKNLEYYAYSLDSELIDRMNISSDVVMQYLREHDDPDNNYALYEPTETERRLFDAYVRLLPGYYQEVLAERLVGIYFVENLYGIGMADYVLSENDQIYSILILNPVAFEKNISELLTYKETTNYSFEDKKLSVQIEVSGDYSGLLYILAHECTHIVDYVDGITPYVEPGLYKLFGENENASPFTSEYWANYHQPKDPPEYMDRLKFYWTTENEKIPDAELPFIYAELETTPFVSLYSYLSWAEDLAEYCTMYHLTQTLGLTYTIRVMENDLASIEYSPFDNPVVQERAAQLGILKAP